jgi:hypothetical protein
LGTTSTSLITIGRLNNYTDLVGTLRINSSSGHTGFVLTSNGLTSSSWERPYIITKGQGSSSEEVIALSNTRLNMSNNAITNCRSIDSSGSTLSIGNTGALGTNLGRTGQTTNLLGNVKFNSSSGNTGNVLISTGPTTAPSWTNYPSISNVLSIGGNNADSNSILNVGSIELHSEPASSIQLGQEPTDGTFKLSSINTSQILDVSTTAKSFSGKYMPITIAGIKYYLPLFTD